MRRTLTHSQKANGYLQKPSLELTNTFSFHFPSLFHSVTSLVRTPQTQANRECKHNRATDSYTRLFQLFKCLQMFVKFGLHQDGAGGIQNTALLALGKITHAETQRCKTVTTGEVPLTV